ncbi:uncharacterized protein LOC111408413 [Olea europaea var. sylvestris]|uniref:uncharacterized protein LOC111408413 n=1 Tax=Olea europaea var. sylvestris TaxID=158386 RepID=UPI000C1D616C|nr:uncharacterized protein LOC111408413 [Olea europaea var. sylvestris]
MHARRATHFCQNLSQIRQSDTPQIISFTTSEATQLLNPHHDALVISSNIVNCLVKCILIDNSSSANVLFLETVKAMGIPEDNITCRTINVSSAIPAHHPKSTRCGRTRRNTDPPRLPRSQNSSQSKVRTRAQEMPDQILMHPADQEKITFMTERDTFCYKVMPFGLKNAGATYQRLVNRMFAEQLKKSMEVYIDDMLVKSLIAKQQIDHLKQSFEVLKKYNMKLNPSKCSFRVSSGKFLGYLVTQREIEANSDQIQSIINIPSPTCIKEVQRLTGRLATLNRSASETQTTSDITTTPIEIERRKQLYMYLAVSEMTVSAVLVCEEHGKQLPIYYVSKALLDAETRYSQLEKLALSLVSAARKLRPYFQSHSIVLTGFIADFAPNSHVLAQRELLCLTNGQETGIWTLQVDGSSNINGTGLSIVLTSPEGDQIEQAIRCEFKATNNEVDYEALIVGLVLAKEIEITRIDIYSHFQLIVNQVQGTFLAKDIKMTSYLELAKRLCKEFDEFHITQVPRTENIQADALASLGATMNMKQSKSWMTPIIRYLQIDELPADKNEARRTKAKAARFCIIDISCIKDHSLDPISDASATQRSNMSWLNFMKGSVIITREPGAWRIMPTICQCLPPSTRTAQPHSFTLVVHEMGDGHIGKLSAAPGQRVFMLAVTDYFTKWIEAEALSKWNIKLNFSTPRYPQANDKLPGVLWSYRTTVRTSTGETPFSLAYNMEAIIPVEIGTPTFRYEWTTDEQNQVELCHELDLADERRERTLIHTVRARTFKEGEWMLQRVFQNAKEAGAGKLAANWEGSYLITKVVGQGAYKLCTQDCRDITNS